MYREKKHYGQDPTKVVRAKTTFNDPLKWQRNYHRGMVGKLKIFTCSWSDFFIEEADEWRPEAWEIIRKTPEFIYQILTKRPERIIGNIPWITEPWPNVWLGVSVENETALHRI